MSIVTLAPAKDGGEKTKTTGRGQQVHYGYPHWKLLCGCLFTSMPVSETYSYNNLL